MSANCCDYGCDGKGFNCPARISQAHGKVMEAEPWTFPDELAEPPDTDLRNDVFYCVGFVLAVGVVWAAVSCVANFI